MSIKLKLSMYLSFSSPILLYTQEISKGNDEQYRFFTDSRKKQNMFSIKGGKVTNEMVLQVDWLPGNI
jgi:hypothetical protein